MAKLVHCKMCGRIVADLAKRCPYCGETSPAFTHKIAKNFLILFITIIVIFSLFISKNTEISHWYEKGNLQASTINEKNDVKNKDE